MSLKESDSGMYHGSVFFLDSEALQDLTSLSSTPDDSASSSYKDVSDATRPARTTFSIFLFLGQEGQKRDTFYHSKADTAPPHAPTVRLPRNRKEGPGARASWVGV